MRKAILNWQKACREAQAEADKKLNDQLSFFVAAFGNAKLMFLFY